MSFVEPSDLPEVERLADALRRGSGVITATPNAVNVAQALVLWELREALRWITDHSQEHCCEVHGYIGYGQALGAVHDRARRAIDPPDGASDDTQSGGTS